MNISTRAPWAIFVRVEELSRRAVGYAPDQKKNRWKELSFFFWRAAENWIPTLTLGEGVDLNRLASRLVRLGASLGVDEVRGKDGVDEGGLAQARLT